MKSLNREMGLHDQELRDLNLKKKAPLHSLDLQHQSLLYEKAYIVKEITLCKDIKYGSIIVL